MAAYIVVEIDVKDPAVFEEYKKLSPATIKQYGGKYLARGGATEVLEGEWKPKRLVILQFDSMDQARTWYNSPEYTHAKEFRQRSSEGRMVLIDCYQEPQP